MFKFSDPAQDHSGSGFCELCCLQVTSSKYIFVEQLKDYLRVGAEILRAVASVVGIALFSLMAMVLFFVRERYRTHEEQTHYERIRRERLEQEREQAEIEQFEKVWQEDKDCQEEQRLLSEYRKQREIIDSMPKPRGANHKDSTEIDDLEDSVDELEERVATGYSNPEQLVEEAQELYKRKLEIEKKERKRSKVLERYNDALFRSKQKEDEVFKHERQGELYEAKRKREESEDLGYLAQDIYKELLSI